MHFYGTLDGAPATLEGELDGETWRGRAEVGGSTYQLEGLLLDGQVQGIVTELGSGATMPLLARLDDRSIEFHAPVTGRLEVSSAGESGTSGGSASGGPADADLDRASLDQRLVGHWLWTDGSFSGDISITLQERLVLSPDGTYQYGDARAVGSGTGVSFNSDPGDVQQGGWRSAGGVLYRSDLGAVSFTPYARYETDGSSLLLLFPDGSKRLWNRSAGA